MRQIWPNNNKDKLRPSVPTPEIDEHFKQELVTIVNEAKDKADLVDSKLSDYKKEQEQAVNTDNVHAQTVTTENSNATNFVGDTAHIQEIDSQEVGAIKVAANRGEFSELTADELHANTGSIDKFTSDSATIGSLEATSIHTPNLAVDNYATDNIEAKNINVSEKVTTPELESPLITSDTLSANEITTDSLDANTAKIRDIDSTVIDTDRIKRRYTLHKQALTISTTDDYWIAVPLFYNGFYHIYTEDENENPVYSIEIGNSIDNIHVSYTKTNALDIQGIYTYKQRAYVHCHGRPITTYMRIGVDSDSTVQLPQIYQACPIDLTKSEVAKHICAKMDGNYFFKEIEDMTKGGLQDLTVEASHNYSATQQPSYIDEETGELVDNSIIYNGADSKALDYYRPDQDVNTNADVKHKSIEVATTIKNPSLFVGTRDEYKDLPADYLDNYAFVIIDEEI